MCPYAKNFSAALGLHRLREARFEPHSLGGGVEKPILDPLGLCREGHREKEVGLRFVHLMRDL